MIPVEEQSAIFKTLIKPHPHKLHLTYAARTDSCTAEIRKFPISVETQLSA